MLSIVIAVWFALHPPPPPPTFGVLPGEIPRDVSPDPKPPEPK